MALSKKIRLEWNKMNLLSNQEKRLPSRLNASFRTMLSLDSSPRIFIIRELWEQSLLQVTRETRQGRNNDGGHGECQVPEVGSGPRHMISFFLASIRI